jgi:hypothetical protein
MSVCPSVCLSFFKSGHWPLVGLSGHHPEARLCLVCLPATLTRSAAVAAGIVSALAAALPAGGRSRVLAVEALEALASEGADNLARLAAVDGAVPGLVQIVTWVSP